MASRVTPIVKLGGAVSSLIVTFQRVGSQDFEKNFPELSLTRGLFNFKKRFIDISMGQWKDL